MIKFLKEFLYFLYCYQIGVSLGSRTWTASFYLLTNLWSNVALSWSQLGGLFVYVDGKMVKSDPAGTARVDSVGQFDPFPDIVIGRSNDAENLAVINENIAVWRMEHINRGYNSTEMTSFVGKYNDYKYLILFYDLWGKLNLVYDLCR